MIEEQKLAAEIHAGNKESEQKFVKTFSPRLYRACVHLLGGAESESDDIVQATFSIAFEKLRIHGIHGPAFVWLRQICLSRCYARLSRRSQLLARQEEDMELYLRCLAMERLESQDPAQQREYRGKLMEGLKRQLSVDSRRIMDMHDLQRMSYSQICHALGIPVGAVMSRLARAREHLKMLIETMSARGLPELRPASGIDPLDEAFK